MERTVSTTFPLLSLTFKLIGVKGLTRSWDFVRIPHAFARLRLSRGKIKVNSLLRWGTHDELTFVQHDCFLRQAQNGRHVVADEQDRASLLCHVTHFAETFLLEFRIAHRQHFIHNKDLRFEVRGDGKRETQIHAR